MGLMDRLLGRARQVQPPAASKGNELVDLACNLLATQIALGTASAGGSNRKRLQEPYARGYVFGFVDAVLQKGGIADETHALALITIAHTKLFGVEMGSLLVGDALNDQSPDTIFAQGRRVGGTDLIRWLNDSKTPPLKLADYLNGAS
jgi:hypothetical protein